MGQMFWNRRRITNHYFCAESTEGLPFELRQWLRTATDGLGKIGIRRVVDDMATHYDEAYRAALNEGLDTDTAAKAALDTLGSPDSARRAFRRQHLTQREEYGMKCAHTYCTTKQWHIALMLSIGLLSLSVNLYERLIEGEAGLRIASQFLVAVMFCGQSAVAMINKNAFQHCRVRRLKEMETAFMLALTLGGVLVYTNVWFSVPIAIGGIWASLWSYKTARKLPAQVTRADLELLLMDEETAQ